MDHFVKDWMSSPVTVIDFDSTVAYAITKMRRRNIHCLITIIPGNPTGYGIVTKADIRDKVLTLSINPAKISISKIMSQPAISVSENATIQECARMMKENHIGHLPVVDEKKQLIGLISTTDLLVAAGEIDWDEDFYK
jgi:CBS domain-containing protein